jgi:hypothetical protein
MFHNIIAGKLAGLFFIITFPSSSLLTVLSLQCYDSPFWVLALVRQGYADLRVRVNAAIVPANLPLPS